MNFLGQPFKALIGNVYHQADVAIPLAPGFLASGEITLIDADTRLRPTATSTRLEIIQFDIDMGMRSTGIFEVRKVDIFNIKPYAPVTEQEIRVLLSGAPIPGLDYRLIIGDKGIKDLMMGRPFVDVLAVTGDTLTTMAQKFADYINSVTYQRTATVIAVGPAGLTLAADGTGPYAGVANTVRIIAKKYKDLQLSFLQQNRFDVGLPDTRINQNWGNGLIGAKSTFSTPYEGEGTIEVVKQAEAYSKAYFGIANRGGRFADPVRNYQDTSKQYDTTTIVFHNKINESGTAHIDEPITQLSIFLDNTGGSAQTTALHTDLTTVSSIVFP